MGQGYTYSFAGDNICKPCWNIGIVKLTFSVEHNDTNKQIGTYDMKEHAEAAADATPKHWVVQRIKGGAPHPINGSFE